jgi:hypothetical protein
VTPCSQTGCNVSEESCFPHLHPEHGGSRFLRAVCTYLPDYRPDGRGSSPGRIKWVFSTPQRPDRLWGSPRLLCDVYRG